MYYYRESFKFTDPSIVFSVSESEEEEFELKPNKAQKQINDCISNVVASETFNIVVADLTIVVKKKDEYNKTFLTFPIRIKDQGFVSSKTKFG